MSTPLELEAFAYQTEMRAREARTAEIAGLYAEIESLRASVEQWRKLATDLIRNGAQLPKEVT